MIKSEAAQLRGWTCVDIAHRDVGSYVAAACKLVAAKVKLPPGYSLTWSGQYEYMQQANKNLAMVVPVTIVLNALLLFFAFRNIAYVLIIMGSLPIALAGSFWLMYLLGYNMSVAEAAGLIALAGVTTEIGVVLLVYLNQSVAAYRERCKASASSLSHDRLRNAVRDGALLPLRPIAMTAAAIISGLLAVILGAGTGSEVMRRIAAPMVGGMICSLILTKLVIPAIYLLWEGRRLRQQMNSTG